MSTTMFFSFSKMFPLFYHQTYFSFIFYISSSSNRETLPKIIFTERKEKRKERQRKRMKLHRLTVTDKMLYIVILCFIVERESTPSEWMSEKVRVSEIEREVKWKKNLLQSQIDRRTFHLINIQIILLVASMIVCLISIFLY